MLNKIKNFFKHKPARSMSDAMSDLSEAATEKVRGHKIVDTVEFGEDGVALIFDNGIAITVYSDDENEKQNASYEFFRTDRPDAAVHTVRVIGETIEPKSHPEGVFAILGILDEEGEPLGGVSYLPKNDNAPRIPSSTCIALGKALSKEEV